MLDNKFKLVRTLTSVGAFFVFIMVLIFSLSQKTVNTNHILLWSGGIIIFWSLLYFGTKLVQKNSLLENEKESETKLPKAVDPENLKIAIKKRIESFEYWNHIKRFGKIIPHSSGKNLIYQFDVNFLYKDKNLGMGCIFLINAHYPNERYSILPMDSGNRAIKLATNALSTNPEEEPDMEKRTEIDLNAGKQIIYEKKTKTKKKEEPKKEKTEDLA